MQRIEPYAHTQGESTHRPLILRKQADVSSLPGRPDWFCQIRHAGRNPSEGRIVPCSTRARLVPALTVEAASPVLIEKVRSGVTDRPRPVQHRGSAAETYSVTFALPSFTTVQGNVDVFKSARISIADGDVNAAVLQGSVGDWVKSCRNRSDV